MLANQELEALLSLLFGGLIFAIIQHAWYCLHQSTLICALQSSKRLEKERTRLMCLAKMQFDDNDIMHLRLLQSVYLNFVGGPGPIGRSAVHASQSFTARVQRGLSAMTSLSHITLP